MPNKNISKWIYVILFLIIILFLYFMIKNKINNNTVKEDNKNNLIQTKWYIPDGDKSLINIYEDENKTITFSKDYSLENYELKNTYLCTSINCKYFDYYYKNSYVIIYDDNYLIYDYKNNRALDLELDKKIYNNIYFCGYKNKVYGLMISNSDNLFAYYSLKENKFLTDFKYDIVLDNENILYKENKIIVKSSNKEDTNYYVINLDNNKILLSSKNEMSVFNNKDYIYYKVKYNLDDKFYFEIYNDDFELVFGDIKYNLFSVSKDGNLVVKNEDDSFSLYTKNGNLIKSSKNYKKILNIVNDYVILIDTDDYLKLVNNDGNVVTKYGKIEDNYVYNYDLSYIDENIIYIIFNNGDINQVKCYYNLSSMEFGNLD